MVEEKLEEEVLLRPYQHKHKSVERKTAKGNVV